MITQQVSSSQNLGVSLLRPSLTCVSHRDHALAQEGLLCAVLLRHLCSG